jgi:hypothetical protein
MLVTSGAGGTAATGPSSRTSLIAIGVAPVISTNSWE